MADAVIAFFTVRALSLLTSGADDRDEIKARRFVSSLPHEASLQFYHKKSFAGPFAQLHSSTFRPPRR